MLKYTSDIDESGKRHSTCDVCGRKWYTHRPLDEIHHACIHAPWALPITQQEAASLFPGEDPTLIGNRVKALTNAIGIPTCGGCEVRRQWMNKAHAWVREQQSNVTGKRICGLFQAALKGYRWLLRLAGR